MRPESSSLKVSAAGVTVDAMRGMLSIMVLLAHALESGLLVVEGSSIPRWMDVLFGHGGFHVNGFFVLSGFCIQLSIISQRKKGGSFGAEYALARVTRLYPLYLLALFLGIAISGWPDLGMLISHLLMLQGISGVMPVIKPAWSLTYEVVYYLAWPLLLAGFGWRQGRAFVAGLIGTLALAGCLFLGWKYWQDGAVPSAILTLGLVAAQFPLWLGGAWLAHAWDDLAPRVRSWMVPSALCWIVANFLAYAWALHHAMPTYVLVVLGWLGLPGWLGLVLGSTRWPAILRWRTAGLWLGLLSYPLYILHQPLLDAVVIFAHSSGMGLSLMEAVVLLLACVMAFMLAVGLPLEVLLLKWRSRVLKSRRVVAVKSAPEALPDT